MRPVRTYNLTIRERINYVVISSENMEIKGGFSAPAMTQYVTGRLCKRHVLFTLSLLSHNPRKLLVVNIFLWLSSEG